MLDVIADFWKPVKKAQTQEKLNPDQLQVGSSIGFGFVPQAILSGRRLNVDTINTYQFGEEKLTSFALTQEKDASAPGVSMIVAEAEGEHYLAISRRIPGNDRAKLFDNTDLDNVLNKADITKLACKDNHADFKGWVVPSYRREIQGLKGRIFKGDFRKALLPAAGEAKEFEYTLLVSESNEHAIEIEKYADHTEIYATIYRRMNDIGEIAHPTPEVKRPDIKLASAPAAATSTSAQAAVTQPPRFIAQPPQATQPPQAAEPPKQEPVKPVPLQLQELSTPATQAETKPAPVQASKPSTPIQEKKIAMPTIENAINGATKSMQNTAEANSPKLFVQSKTPENYMKQEVKAVTNGALNNFEADSIECDLRVANKIIDEAIRNEMRLTDIVRRIIELPVAYPESVQIPVTLTDEDYALLAIRYGVPSSDRNAIKRRIIDDLNDFSGGAKKAA